MPVTPAVRDAMAEIRNRWLRRAEDLAGLEHQRMGGWHAFRRAWATKRKDLTLKDVAAAGGWEGTQVLQQIYQQADIDTLGASLWAVVGW